MGAAGVEGRKRMSIKEKIEAFKWSPARQDVTCSVPTGRRSFYEPPRQHPRLSRLRHRVRLDAAGGAGVVGVGMRGEIMDEVTYQVGQIGHQSEDDLTFDNYDQAIEAAENESWDDAVWAVRQWPDGDVKALVYQQRVYQ